MPPEYSVFRAALHTVYSIGRATLAIIVQSICPCVFLKKTLYYSYLQEWTTCMATLRLLQLKK